VTVRGKCNHRVASVVTRTSDHQIYQLVAIVGGLNTRQFKARVAEAASDHRDQLRELGWGRRRWARWPQDRYAISVGVSDQLNRQ
jgi:hypothetical protein